MPTAFERSRALDARRSVLFAAASAAALVSAVVQLATQHKRASELSSVVVCAVTSVLLRARKPGTRQGALIAATLFYVVTMLLVALTLYRVTDVVLVFALPLGLGVVFIDRLSQFGRSAASVARGRNRSGSRSSRLAESKAHRQSK